MKTCSIAFLAFALIHGSKTHPRSQFLHNVLKHALLFPPVLFFTSIQPVRFSLFSRFISHQIVFSSQNKSAVSAFQPTYKLKRTGEQTLIFFCCMLSLGLDHTHISFRLPLSPYYYYIILSLSSLDCLHAK